MLSLKMLFWGGGGKVLPLYPEPVSHLLDFKVLEGNSCVHLTHYCAQNHD